MRQLFHNLTSGEIRNTIAIVVVLLSFTFLFMLLFVHVPKENENIVNIATGAIIVTGLASVISYYFGSSKGEQDKKEEQP